MVFITEESLIETQESVEAIPPHFPFLYHKTLKGPRR